MNDYFGWCPKTNDSLKSNIKLQTVVTEVMIWSKWSKPHDVVVVKIASWNSTEARIMTGAGADTGGMHPPTRPKVVLTRHLISLKIIAKNIFVLHTKN